MTTDKIEAEVSKVQGWRAYDANLPRIPPNYVTDHDAWFTGYDAAQAHHKEYMEERAWQERERRKRNREQLLARMWR